MKFLNFSAQPPALAPKSLPPATVSLNAPLGIVKNKPMLDYLINLL